MSVYPATLIAELENYSRQLRMDSLEMIYRRRNGHPGGSLSAAEILAVLFFHTLILDPARPDWVERDRFLLSKGHASAILYAALARRGFFPLEDLWNWGQLSCHLQGHPDRLKTPGVEMSTGMLGHGLAIGAGMALAGRLQAHPFRVYTLLGDGECQAGVIWEGAMTAAKYHLSNLHAIVDQNDVQLDGPVTQIMPVAPFAEKWRAFGWEVVEIDGHSVSQLLQALDAVEEIENRPSVILAHTIKGKGVSFMENNAHWHGVAPNTAEYQQAMRELEQGQ
jgi:transketolase